MARSNLTTKFIVGTVNRFQKSYRDENEDCKKKNIARYITVDVINRKGVPDIDDVLLLIKLGNNMCDDVQAEAILERWLEDENNKARGIAGAFCEVCKDYCLDIPVDSLHKEQCEQLEDIINKRIEMQKQLASMADKMTELIDKFKDIQANKEAEADTGTEIESTQE
jgi:uncharacterized coiled-coil protein SlyX